MTNFHQIKLEFVRPGPMHNQLLSPLTSYIALCGEGSAVTLNINLEHHELLSRLERLRYVTNDGSSGRAVPNSMRESTVAIVGRDVGKIIGNLRTLFGEEWRAVGNTGDGTGSLDSHIIHMRLVLNGSELSLIPFEMAIAPQGVPGEGLEWVLQSHMPVVLTREIRRTRPESVSWDRPLEPKILLVSATPSGMDVPLAAHVQALRGALEPWIPWPIRKPEDESPSLSPKELHRQRLKFVKERLRIIQYASVEDIYDICSKEEFTHVHILAHGAHTTVARETRFGLALCAQGDRNEMKVVSGKNLAKALQPEAEDGSRRFHPLMVTLATCDSGNPGSILVPGGSIAHDLHTAGIPWVFASQFPLTKIGSVRMVEALYSRILRGDDPRQAMFEVRRQLFMRAERDHDWASLVVYATVPDDFDDQVMSFFELQTRRAITVSLNRADNAGNDADIKTALNASLEMLDLWKSRLPSGDGSKDRDRRAECYGIHGSTWKRIGLLHYRKDKASEGLKALETSLAWYRNSMGQWSMDEDKYHWVATQALSLMAVLRQKREPVTFLITRQLAERDLAKSTGSRKAWAHGTLAELEMLATYHTPDKVARNVKKAVREHCKAIAGLMGERSFEVDSTRRQFQRYIDFWGRKEWRSIAEEAVSALSPPGGSGLSELPPYA